MIYIYIYIDEYQVLHHTGRVLNTEVERNSKIDKQGS